MTEICDSEYCEDLDVDDLAGDAVEALGPSRMWSDDRAWMRVIFAALNEHVLLATGCLDAPVCGRL